MLMNTVVASMEPLRFDPERWRRILLEYKINGQSVLDTNTAEGRDTLDWLMSLCENLDTFDPALGRVGISSRARMLELARDGALVTDDNMRTEFGRPW
jgi:hypothetical protein